MASKQEIGGNLEEIEKAGLKELPAIANSFDAASTALSGISTSRMFTTGGPFATNTPAADFGELMSALSAANRKSGSVLTDVAEALVTTARDFARTDDEIAAAFTAAGGELP